MASTKWTRRNVNRYKKIYPFVQRTPKYKYLSDQDAIVEVADIGFNSESEKQYIFQEKYPSIPVVTAVSNDTGLSTDADVSIMLKDLSKVAVTIQASQEFIGSIQLHIIWIDPNPR